jgi:hypothetical protein
MALSKRRHTVALWRPTSFGTKKARCSSPTKAAPRRPFGFVGLHQLVVVLDLNLSLSSVFEPEAKGFIDDGSASEMPMTRNVRIDFLK